MEEMLSHLKVVKESPGFQMFHSELEEAFNRAYRESMDDKLSSERRVMKLEQQRGIALAMNLMDVLIGNLEDEIASRRIEAGEVDPELYE
jgi:hypothetical protein